MCQNSIFLSLTNTEDVMKYHYSQEINDIPYTMKIVQEYAEKSKKKHYF